MMKVIWIQSTADIVVTLRGDFTTLMAQLRAYDGLTHILSSTSTLLDECDFRKRCSELEENENVVGEKMITMCKSFVAAIDSPVNVGSLVGNVLGYHEELCLDMMEDVRSEGQETQGLVPGGWDTAWDTRYEDRALENFLDYLDVLWGQRRENWNNGKPTANSFCGSIVQSSCAGKSRLVSA
jgi:hypothetical protein